MKLRECVPGTKVRVVGRDVRKVFPKVRKQTARIVFVDKKFDEFPVFIKFKQGIHTATKSGRTIYVRPDEIELA